MLIPRPLLSRLLGPRASWYFRFGLGHLASSLFAFAPELALEEIMHYVQACKVPGDYFEFGVFEGRLFSVASYLARKYKLDMDLWAFDSFQGIPRPDALFERGDFCCSEERFRRNLKKNGADFSRIHIVPGWYDELPPIATTRPAAIVYIDCDLYESTVSALRLIEPHLQTGSVIAFDDWNLYRADPCQGERRAFAEWLAQHPAVHAEELIRFGWAGKSFVLRLP